MNSRLALLVLVGLVGCTSDERDIDADLARAAERARELPFLRAPRVERQTRASYIAAAEERGRSESDEDIAELRAVHGRLGFVPKDYDVRKARGEVARIVGASYSAERKTITLFENTPDQVYVHELVHALQDQHLGLQAFDDEATSTDAFLARRAVSEGDATLADARFAAEGDLRRVQGNLDLPGAEQRAETLLSSVPTPAYFLAYPSFVYPYGSSLAARAAGVFDGQFVRERLDALFADDAPKSTEEVIRRVEQREVDPIEPVGLAALPKDVATDFDVVSVDCVGAWQTYLLFRDRQASLGARSLVTQWDGDQLVVIGERDPSIPPKRKAPVAIVWTSIWENDDVAAAFARRFEELQDALADGEDMILEREGKQVVFVKGAIDAVKMRTLADAALRRPPVLPPLATRRKSPHVVHPF